MNIARSAGMPLKVDPNTQRHGPYARVQVDVDCSLDLPTKVLVQRKQAGFDFFANLYYEFVPHYCHNCGTIGHKSEACRTVRRARKEDNQKPATDIRKQGTVALNQDRAINLSGSHSRTQEADVQEGTGIVRPAGGFDTVISQETQNKVTAQVEEQTTEKREQNKQDEETSEQLEKMTPQDQSSLAKQQHGNKNSLMEEETGQSSSESDSSMGEEGYTQVVSRRNSKRKAKADCNAKSVNLQTMNADPPSANLRSKGISEGNQ